MHFDKWFLRIVGVGTLIGVCLQGWAVYRIEVPKAIPAQATQISVQSVTSSDPQPSKDRSVNTPPTLWLILLVPLISGAMILIAAIVVSRRGRESGLVIHRAYFQVWGSWPRPKKDYTEAVKAMVKDNFLQFLPGSRFGDPFPNKFKRFVVEYSVDGVRHELSRANGESIQIGRAPELAKATSPSRLKIHSAFYGAGNHNDIDLAESLQKLIPRDALAITVDNNLIPGHPDPAPNQPKHLKVIYSFGGPDTIPLDVPEHELLILPRDWAYGRELGLHYETQRIREREAIIKDFESEITNRSNPFAMPASASAGDRLRRQRAEEVFKTLLVPQKFILRWISKCQRVSRSELIRFGREAGFGEDCSPHINYMSLHCELVKTEVNNDLTLNPSFLDDVDAVLAAWFTRISSSSEAL